jgi:hypothetical protein
VTDIHIDGGFQGFKGGLIGQVRLLMLDFYSMVGGTTVNMITIYTNTHGSPCPPFGVAPPRSNLTQEKIMD